MVESVCTGLKSGNLGIIMGFGCCVIFFRVILGLVYFFWGGAIFFLDKFENVCTFAA